MEKFTILFDTPQKTAASLTDNPLLQDFLEAFLSINNQEARTVFENKFWTKVSQFPSAQQSAIRAANARIAQRLREGANNRVGNTNLLYN